MLMEDGRWGKKDFPSPAATFSVVVKINLKGSNTRIRIQPKNPDPHSCTGGS